MITKEEMVHRTGIIAALFMGVGSVLIINASTKDIGLGIILFSMWLVGITSGLIISDNHE